MCPRLIVQETRVPSCTTVLSLYLHGMLYVVKSRETDEDRRLSGLRMYIGSLSPSLPQLVNHVSAYISWRTQATFLSTGTIAVNILNRLNSLHLLSNRLLAFNIT